MPCLINVINDIMSDFSKEIYRQSKVLSRRFILGKGTILLVSAYKNSQLAEISLSLFDTDPKQIGKMPKWKGMTQAVGTLSDQKEVCPFISFKQSEDYDQTIFLTIMQDIVDSVADIDNKYMLATLKEVLGKWSVFFQFEKEYVLSENAQQGLYAELYVLEQMMEEDIAGTIDGWTGCNAESHDFYIGKNALEIKSSSLKGPDKIKISNEYQLDDIGIHGKLYLMYLKLKKSEVHGESLPDIVERIMSKLSTVQKNTFQSKLLKVGYLYQLPELYIFHFVVKDEMCYIVKDGFPRIIKQNIPKGIGAVSYSVSLDACEKFVITIESFFKGVAD